MDEISEKLFAEAKHSPRGWVYIYDWEYGQDEHVPPEAIIGAYAVDEFGEIVGEMTKNDRHSSIRIACRDPRPHMVYSLGPHEKDEWQIEIDPEFDHLFPNIPDHGWIGSWYLGKDGKYTGHFRPNPLYRGSIET